MIRRDLLASACALALLACESDTSTPAADTATATDTAVGGDASDAADTSDTAGPDLMLHVPSPDWSEQVIYFIMIDRFANGDTSNDDQGAGVYDPTDFRKYSGGDLQGIIDQLDYIQNLGATAIWITPPVANQWWDPRQDFGGYHGYWARHFKEVDEHYGTLDDYKALSDALHRRGMYLIQDVVPNHTGNFYSWDGAYDGANPQQNFVINTQSVPVTAPEQAPFDLNDATNPDHFAAAIYHWTPAIADFTDIVQEQTWQISDLDDLNTENPVVREALRDSFGYWIREVGVDAFRIDTVKFIDHDFWHDFIHSTDAETPGINAAAAATGRDDFLTFGEVFEVSQPFDNAGEVKATSFLGTDAKPELAAVLGFPLYEEMKRVIGDDEPTALMTYRLEQFMDTSLFKDPYITPNFIDNHDVDRFLKAASVEAFEQALLLMYTIPGIPTVWMGSEQGFLEPRQSLFAAGYLSGGVDHYDQTAPLYTFIQGLADLRKGNAALTKGSLEVLVDSEAGAGIFAYRRAHQATSAIVVMNTSTEAVLAEIPTGFPSGQNVSVLSSARLTDDEPTHVSEGGALLVELPARSHLVLGEAAGTTTLPTPTATITVDTAIANETFTEDTVVTGTIAPATARLQMVVDDSLGGAVDLTVDANGSWTATLPIASFPFGDTPHTVTFYAPDDGVASERFAFTSSTTFDGQIVTVTDPIGDDVGPNGTYFLPGDASFADNPGTMDIVSLTIEAAATELRLKFEMNGWSTVWNPSNGFDHVSFNIYFDIPDENGLTLLPRIGGTAPADFAWDRMSFIYGWSNSLHTTEDATADAWGAPSPGRPTITTDPANKTLTLTYTNLSALGVTTFEGMKVYATIWDFDGIDSIYRPLSVAGTQWGFGGGEPTDPKILDDVGPVTIPTDSGTP